MTGSPSSSVRHRFGPEETTATLRPAAQIRPSSFSLPGVHQPSPLRVQYQTQRHQQPEPTTSARREDTIVKTATTITPVAYSTVSSNLPASANPPLPRGSRSPIPARTAPIFNPGGGRRRTPRSATRHGHSHEFGKRGLELVRRLKMTLLSRASGGSSKHGSGTGGGSSSGGGGGSDDQQQPQLQAQPHHDKRQVGSPKTFTSPRFSLSPRPRARPHFGLRREQWSSSPGTDVGSWNKEDGQERGSSVRGIAQFLAGRSRGS